MNCEEVRAQLPDYTLGTLSETEAAAVRRHLRACSGCRLEARTLDEGVAMFAGAAHAMDPPPDLKARVMGVLAQEWAEAPRPRIRRTRSLLRWTALAAAIVALAGSLTWGSIEQRNADRLRADSARSASDAASYRLFLHALGGRDVRVVTFVQRSDVVVDGSAVLYDSDQGQSWVLVMARVPGYIGQLTVSLSSTNGHAISLQPLHIDGEGDGSTWLVTSSDISGFRTVTLRLPDGPVIASGTAIEP
jgi:hypothetical protein